MTWMSTTMALTAIFLVSLQSISFFSRANKTDYTVMAGILSLCLAAGGLIAFFLFRAGALIASPEYGVILVQGTAARAWACLLLLGAAIAGGIIWQIAREAKKLPSHRVVVLPLGVVIGLLAAYEFQNLNPSDPTPFCIRFYDLWWPPLLVWLVVCLSQWVATTIDVVSQLGRVLWAAFCVAGIGFVPVARSYGEFRYGDLSSAPLWRLIGCLGTPLFMALSPLVFMKSKSGRVRVAISALAGCAGLASALSWTKVFEYQVPWIFQPWILWVAWVVAFGGWALVRLHFGSFKLPSLSPKGRRGDIWAVIALLGIVWSLADLTHFIQFDPAWDLATLIFFWIVLLEMIACAKIIDLHGTARRRVDDAKTRLRKIGGIVGNRIWQTVLSQTVPSQTAPSPTERLQTAPSQTAPSQTGSLLKSLLSAKTGVLLIVWLMVVVVVLITANEIPNAGKTIVHPFATAGLPNDGNSEKETEAAGPDQKNTDRDKENTKDRDKEKNKYLEHAVADRVANTLALVGQELRPDVLVAVSPKGEPRAPDRGDKGRVAWESATSEENDGLEVAAKSSSLNIPGTTGSVPLEFLTAPIQGSVRNLLDIRTIRGSIQASGNKDNKYVLLASSSNGQTWQAASEFEPFSNAKIGGCGKRDEQPEVLSGELKLAQLADMLAYKIVSSDPTLIKRGGTSSWRALKPFHDGMVAWNNFELTTDYTFLNASITNFREAVCEDPRFALAQYWLGRALTSDGQPGAAVMAYRDSLQAYPGFVVSHIALAGTLLDFDNYHYYPPPAVSADNDRRNEAASTETSNFGLEFGSTPAKINFIKLTKLGMQHEARRLWRRVIQELDGDASVSDQAAAYTGLCLMAQPEKQADNPAWWSWLGRLMKEVDDKDQVSSRYAPFFYCKRAEYLYSKLPSSLRGDGQIKAARASTLNQIGKILDDTPLPVGSHSTPAENQEQQHINWSCGEPRNAVRGNLTAVSHWLNTRSAQPARKPGPYIQYALKYYERALAVLPEDWETRCNFAVDSHSAGDDHPMHELYADAYIHIKRGDRLWGEASDSKSPEKYKEAIDEYQQATDLSPANTEAMNDYANAFWDWRLRFAQDPSLDSIAQQAKDFAQRANAMTTTAGTTTHLINAATLIEVLLGTARADKALEVLEKKEEELPDHAFFNDVRWDLAQAYLCAAADARQAQVSFHQRYNPQAKAQALFQKILELEATRESQPFTDLFKKIHEREKTRETQPFTDTSPNALNDKVCFLRQPIASEASPNRMLLHSNHNEKNPRKARSLGQVAEGLKESR